MTLALVLLGWPLTRRLAGEAGPYAMFAGIGLSAIASVCGGLPVLRIELRGERARVQDVMASLVIRLFVVLAGLFCVILLGRVATTPFLVSVGLSYLLLLPADIHYAVRGIRGSAGE